MKAELPTLIILSPGFPADEADTTCLPLQQNLIRAINKNFSFINIIILSFQYPFTQSEYDWFGNKVIAFGGSNKGSFSRIFLWQQVWRKLKEINKENNVKGVFSFWLGECALIGKRFAKEYKINHFTWILGQDAKKKNKYVKWAKPFPDQLVALSDFIAHEFYKNHQITPWHIIPPGVDSTELPEEKTKRSIDVLGVGSLISLKQYEIFITIISELKKRFPAIKAVLCGKGPEEEKLKNMIAFFELEKNISLLGERPNDEVLEIMKCTKVFLHPSSYEGFGVVCIEALSAGAHVISFCKPMSREIEHWHIVKNKPAMLEKIITLLKDDNIDYKPVIPFSIDDCAVKVFDLFDGFS